MPVSIFFSIETVISENYEVEVFDEEVLAGNNAVLRCRVPTDEDYFVVSSWLKDDKINILPSVSGGR